MASGGWYNLIFPLVYNNSNADLAIYYADLANRLSGSNGMWIIFFSVLWRRCRAWKMERPASNICARGERSVRLTMLNQQKWRARPVVSNLFMRGSHFSPWFRHASRVHAGTVLTISNNLRQIKSDMKQCINRCYLNSFSFKYLESWLV